MVITIVGVPVYVHVAVIALPNESVPVNTSTVPLLLDIGNTTVSLGNTIVR